MPDPVRATRPWLGLIVALGLGCASPSGPPPASSSQPAPPPRPQPVIGEHDPHAHLSLVTTPLPETWVSAIDVHVAEIRRPDFLATLGARSRNPFAPCALVVAGYTGVALDAYWGEVLRGNLQIPRGTNILGKFDLHLRSGRIPRNDPAQTAEILARVFIWSSWARDGGANALIDGLTQQQCLDQLYTTPQALGARVRGLDDTLMTHSEPVSLYSGVLRRDVTQQFFMELPYKQFMARPAGGTDNPLAPCSLLRALVLASRLSRGLAAVMSRVGSPEFVRTPPPRPRPPPSCSPMRCARPRRRAHRS